MFRLADFSTLKIHHSEFMICANRFGPDVHLSDDHCTAGRLSTKHITTATWKSYVSYSKLTLRLPVIDPTIFFDKS